MNKRAKQQGVAFFIFNMIDAAIHRINIGRILIAVENVSKVANRNPLSEAEASNAIWRLLEQDFEFEDEFSKLNIPLGLQLQGYEIAEAFEDGDIDTVNEIIHDQYAHCTELEKELNTIYELVGGKERFLEIVDFSLAAEAQNYRELYALLKERFL